MSVFLRVLAEGEFAPWLERSREEYAQDLVAQGQSVEAACSAALASLRRVFPDDAPVVGQFVFNVVDENANAVGYLWIGQDSSADPAAWWVWDIVINDGCRGQGHGRRVMMLGEDFARDRGAQTLGLSVFGANSAAKGLYESLGYEVSSIKMAKTLGRP